MIIFPFSLFSSSHFVCCGWRLFILRLRFGSIAHFPFGRIEELPCYENRSNFPIYFHLLLGNWPKCTFRLFLAAFFKCFLSLIVLNLYVFEYVTMCATSLDSDDAYLMK